MLSDRALNRASLARQLLLRREALPVVEATEQVLGLNAQDADLPYLALWARVDGFAIPELTAAIEDRALVRSTMMRATQHLMSVRDFALVRPQLAALLRRVQRNAFGSRTRDVDLDELAEAARELLAEGRVLTRSELGRRLAERWSGTEPSALGWSAQYLVPVVHPAPSGTWGVRGPTPFAAADWTGASQAPTSAGLREIVRRYLAAFGPATPADARSWCGVGGLRDVFEALRPELRVDVDASGRELFDLPEAPRPDPDTPAPVRFLPAFDALLLAYADRSRVMTDEIRREVCDGAAVAATVLVDGTVAATWSFSQVGDTAVAHVRPLRCLSASARADIEAEAARLLHFVSPDASHQDVRVLALSGQQGGQA